MREIRPRSDDRGFGLGRVAQNPAAHGLHLGILHCLRHLPLDAPLTKSIDATTAGAIEIAEFFAEHALTVFGLAAENRSWALARRIVTWMQ